MGIPVGILLISWQDSSSAESTRRFRTFCDTMFRISLRNGKLSVLRGCLHHDQCEILKPCLCHISYLQNDIQDLASFPGRSHRQYFIASSMKYGGGEAWEIWSRAMPSSRHMVDTGRVVPNKESRRPMLYCLYQSVHKADDRYRSLFTTPATDQHETGILTVGHHPPLST